MPNLRFSSWNLCWKYPKFLRQFLQFECHVCFHFGLDECRCCYLLVRKCGKLWGGHVRRTDAYWSSANVRKEGFRIWNLFYFRVLDEYSWNASHACWGLSPQDYNQCCASYLSENAGHFFCAGARSYNILVSDPAFQYWSGYGGKYSNANHSYVIAFCIFRGS